jgi:hypothetical protein
MKLWLRCFALGGTLDGSDPRATVQGARTPTAHEHDVIAQALNEYFLDHGLSSPVVYSEGLDNPYDHP